MSRFLDPQTLAALGDLALVARTVVAGFLAGTHPSRRTGAGHEFAQYRSYGPGDDLRRVDWKLYGRSDRFYIREAEVDTNVAVRLVLDATASMAHEEDGLAKLDVARFLVAAFAHLAAGQGDAVGLEVIGEAAPDSLPPRRGAAHERRLLHTLETVEARGVWPSWDRVAHRLAGAQREVVVVVTDLHERGREIRDALARVRANEVLLLSVLGRAERTLAHSGVVTFEDLETGRTVRADAARARDAYRARMEAHLEAVRGEMAEREIDVAVVMMDEPLDGTLRTFLQRRARL